MDYTYARVLIILGSLLALFVIVGGLAVCMVVECIRVFRQRRFRMLHGPQEIG